MTPGISSISEAEQEAVKLAVSRLGVSSEDVRIISSEEAMWPDTSLGMPEQGIIYAQMLVEGYRVKLSINDRILEIHFGNGLARMRIRD